jgi:EAL domain-containing protein (putative c-di-GMP-specific phosphodiesterase class I)/GGDEF domain-containing protein
MKILKTTKTIIIHLSIAVLIAMVVWISHFYRFPQHDTPIVILGSGVILGLLYRMAAKALPVLLVGLFISHYYLIGYSFVVSAWFSFSMLTSGWLAYIYLRKTLSHDLIERPVRNFLHFYVAAFLVSPITSFILDFPLIWLDYEIQLPEDVRLLVFSYTFGEAMGALVFAPAIALFGRKFHLKYAYADYSAFKAEKMLWLTLAVLLVIVTIMMGEKYFFAGLLDAELFLYPMIAWSALRLGVVFTNIAVAIMAYTIFTFHFFGFAGTSGGMTIPQTLGMLLLIITLAILAQMVAAVSLERRKKEAALEHTTLHDPVTGLPNRRSLEKTMAVISSDERGKNNYLLGYASICNFDTLVQGYGLEAQNSLFRQFAGFLKMETDSDARIFRVSDSAFVLLLMERHALAVMKQLTEKIKQFSFIWLKKSFHINAVFSLVPIDYVQGETHGPIEHASTLAEKAYEQGNIGSVITSNRDQDIKRRENRADWLGRINKALAQNHFTLVAQPIVQIEQPEGSHHQHYFEILLRLEGADGSLELPGEFITHAENFNLMPSIDRWVVRHTLQWLSSVKNELDKIALCSMNLSGQAVADPQFCSDIEQWIQEYSVPAEKLCFEITETAAIANMHIASAFVSRLQKSGCSVALDDFGSGLSSFEYLKKLPVNILKIDGIFIRNMPQSSTDCIIVDSVWRVAQNMNLSTVAEYVESEEILQLLTEMGVTYAQGYHIGKPVLLEEILDGG